MTGLRERPMRWWAARAEAEAEGPVAAGRAAMPYLRASVGKVTYGFTAPRHEAVTASMASEPEPRSGLPDAILLRFAKAAVAAGVWSPPAGVPVEEALDAFAAGMRFVPEG